MTNTNNTDTNNTDTMTDREKRAAFASALRDEAGGGGFDVSDVADIGLKSLVAATCGVVLYKTIFSSSAPTTSGDS